VIETYHEFLASKSATAHAGGNDIPPDILSPDLYPFQRQLVSWAIAKGRCALFADTGLGKTRMQIEWAAKLPTDTLILAPLAVAQQTIAEAALMGVSVNYVRDQSEVTSGISITNYEMAHAFDFSGFDGVILDESSILKSVDGKTRKYLTEQCADVTYKLCCTATPAPNDIAEFANHAEFLGVATRQEMLSMFFVHDQDGWRLKGHARDAFYKWMASWGMMVKAPSDIGYSDDGYDLPALTVEPEWVSVDSDDVMQATGQMFFTKIGGITGRAQIRRATMADKIEIAIVELESSSDQWIVWHGLNDEGRLLNEALDGAVLVEGADSIESKVAKLHAFTQGSPSARILITKPSIAGFGLNLQNCHNVMFLGMNDSYEQWYQSIRRCWRFGQTRPVTVKPILSEMERPIYENVRAKESAASEVSRGMIDNVSEYQRTELGISDASNREYREDTHVRRRIYTDARRLC